MPAWLVCTVCGNLVMDDDEQCTYCGDDDPCVPPTDGIVWRIETVPWSGRPCSGRSWTQQVSLQSRIQADGTWAHIYRFIDREDDKYLEFVHDHEGREIRHVRESLTVHRAPCTVAAEVRVVRPRDRHVIPMAPVGAGRTTRPPDIRTASRCATSVGPVRKERWAVCPARVARGRAPCVRSRWMPALQRRHTSPMLEKRAGCHNSAVGVGLVFYATCSYSLMRPPRTGRRLICCWVRSAAGWSGRGGCSWRLRWGRRPL
jgi:hypothetical protein